MDKIIGILSALEPVIVGGIGLAALIVVPLVTKAILSKLSADQQRAPVTSARRVTAPATTVPAMPDDRRATSVALPPGCVT